MTTTTTTIREGGFRMNWGAVFAGAIVTLGLWILLHVLGLAAGLTAIDPQDQGSLRGIGIGTGIWTVIVPLLALFAGGYVAARSAGLLDRTTGALHGAVVWGLTVLAGTALVATVVSSTVRAGLAVAERGMGAIAAAPAGLDAMGIGGDEIMRPVNERLQQQGLPPVTPDRLQAATGDVLRQAVTSGELDRRALVDSMVRNLGMNQSEAEQTATRMQSGFEQQKEQLRQKALAAADCTGKALWVVFFALLLGLGAAAGGAIVGNQRRAAVVVEEQPSPGPGTRHVPIETHG